MIYAALAIGNLFMYFFMFKLGKYSERIDWNNLIKHNWKPSSEWADDDIVEWADDDIFPYTEGDWQHWSNDPTWIHGNR